MGCDDAFDNCQAKAHAGLIAADAFGAALEGFGECGDQLGSELFTSVFDSEQNGFGADNGVDLYGATFGKVVDDGVVQKVRDHL